MLKTLGRIARVAGVAAALWLPAVATAGPLDELGALKAVTCTACHGENGNSRSDAMPILAGMDPAYFKKQIEAYAAGKRPSPEMEPYAKQVLDLGVDDLAAYFAKQKFEPTPIRPSAAAVQRGRAAAAQCVVCHGQDGRGDPAKGVPSLVGQPPGYLREQMLLFKADRRNPGDQALAALKALMKTIPEETFADLAAYYSRPR
jgi:cytochrome c553